MSRVIAPAKLTLTLRLVGVRSDGYHLIDAEMASLDLHDTLTFADADAVSIEVTGRFAAGVPTDESNLVAKALRMVGRTASVRLDKQIPAQGGLGGGSSDAAAVLRWAGVDDLLAAAQLGADVPFCLVGGRARVTGIGEIVEPLPPSPTDVTLCIPPIGVSTVAAYRAWDDMGGPTAEGPNDLETAAFAVAPELVRWRDRFREATGATPVLAGSGSTMFVTGHHRSAGEAMVGAVVIQARTA